MSALHVLEFTPPNELREVEFEPWQPGDTFEAWIARAGFESNGGGDSVCLDENAIVDQREVLVVHRAVAQKQHPWFALVYVGMAGAELDAFVVRSAGDLVRLKMFVKPLVDMAIAQEAVSLVKLARRAFTAWHGRHEWYEACEKCDPSEARMEARIEARREAEKRARAEEPKCT